MESLAPPPTDPLVRREPPFDWYRTPVAMPRRVETPDDPITLDPDIAMWPVTPLSRWPFIGAPTEGGWPVGWMGVDAKGTIYVCTVGGSPGTWVAAGSGTSGHFQGVYTNADADPPGTFVDGDYYVWVVSDDARGFLVFGTDSGWVIVPWTGFHFTNLQADTLQLAGPGSSTLGGTVIINSFVGAAEIQLENQTRTADPYDLPVGVDPVVYYATSGGTVVLPDATTCVQFVQWLKNTSGGGITISTTSAQTIDGAATLAMPNNSAVMLQSDGSNWQIMS